MPTGRAYPTETRVTCVAEIIAGEPIRAVARRYGIPYQTVESWWREDRPAGPATARTRARVADAVYDAAVECLEGVRATAVLLQDQRWAKKQPAGDLAQLVSVLADRSVRMLWGLQPDTDGREPPAIASSDVAARVLPADGPEL